MDSTALARIIDLQSLSSLIPGSFTILFPLRLQTVSAMHLGTVIIYVSRCVRLAGTTDLHTWIAKAGVLPSIAVHAKL